MAIPALVHALPRRTPGRRRLIRPADNRCHCLLSFVDIVLGRRPLVNHGWLAGLRIMPTPIDVREIVDYCQLLLTKVTARR